MEKEQIKKIDALYIFTYIFIPIAVCAICYIISALFFPKGNMAVILIMGPTIISIVWWIFGGKILFKQKQKKWKQN